MSKRNVTIVAGLVAGLMLGAGATAFADTFTPSIEEPVFQLGLLRGTPLGGSVPDGNSSSANPGRAYQPGYSDYSGGADESPEDLYGYWRADGDTGRGDSGRNDSGRGDSGRNDSGRGDSGRNDSGRGDSGRGDSDR